MSFTIHWFDEVDSTNRVAREPRWVHGDVIASTSQISGRGRMERTWEMDPGAGLALSLIVSRRSLGEPRFLTRLPLVAAVALAEFVRQHASRDHTVTVKWPNDVLLDGRKVAGILVEALDDDRLAMGIGINLTGTPESLPRGAATSLADANVTIAAEDVVSSLARAILDHAADLDSDTVRKRLADSLDTLHRDVRLELPDGRVVVGRATGIGETGSLLVLVDGHPTEFVAADVTHLRLSGHEADSVG